MLNNLKKVKLELGGDNLQLAVAKADTIDALSRFRNKSEPTWLFIVNGRATSIMFGANVPRLTQTITKELELLGRKTERKTYAIDEPQPIEVELIEAKQKQDEENARVEREAEELKRKAYLNFCTNTIMKNMQETGISICGPHINRDGLKKVLEIADREKLQTKDRKVSMLEPSQIEILDYASSNPIEPKVLDHMYNKELIIIMWKLAEGETRPIEEALFALRDGISKPYPDENEPEEMLPPLFPPLEIKVYEDLLEKLSETKSEMVNKVKNATEPAETKNEAETDIEAKETNENDEKENEVEEEKTEEEQQEPKDTTEEKHQEENVVETEKEKQPALPPAKIIYIPSLWTPANKRTNAAGIYVFFRHQTLPFLPPDPIPDPPHLVVIFDAYKKKEIRDLITKWNEDVLSYGFFTSEDPNEAKVVANSAKNYEECQAKDLTTDKIVVKISKKTSDCLLAFSKCNPSYVSENCVTGEQEAAKFFPKEYKTGEQEEAEAEAAKEAASRAKRKSKKKEEPTPTDEEGQPQNEAEPTAPQ
ncbi:thioredoxin domain-containing protein 6 isoform X2 [Condylostylus longicornis]|nr:thioredoxin domain-containing protein 6 isoform X2 [Condylostylus longicornis]